VASKKDILRIMRRRKVDFDEARRIFMESKLAKNGIAPDGRPTGGCFPPFEYRAGGLMVVVDPRAVFFS
jgi:hypothetical protein